MDLDALRVFVKVAELSSFTRAADQLGMPKSRVSMRVKDLEIELGSQLLQRTTRAVRPTPDGEQVLARARRLLLEADDLSGLFQASRALRGRVRLDLPVNLARDTIIPRLPELLAEHPQLELLVSTTDRRVELVREGFDLVLRVGAQPDSGLVARKLGVMPMVNVASAGYVRRFGVPRTLDELDRHVVVHYAPELGGEPPSFEYVEGAVVRERPMRSLITVNSVDGYTAACLAGLGIIQVPRFGQAGRLSDGTVIEILPEHLPAPMPVSLVHAHGRNVPRRVRVVMAWLDALVRPRLS
jgi:DNA-binding transcriptional LysR family regulator